MSDIFISYASEDRSRVEPLAKALEDQGWSIWWDRTIPVGKTWREVIGEALETARSVIVVWSKTSVKSRWVQEEADKGLKKNILIPVLIDNVDPPLGFSNIQAADLTNWVPAQSCPEFEKLIADITTIFGSSATASITSEAAQDKAKLAEPKPTEPRTDKTKSPAKRNVAKIALLIALALVIVAGSIMLFRLVSQKLPEPTVDKKAAAPSVKPESSVVAKLAQPIASVDETQVISIAAQNPQRSKWIKSRIQQAFEHLDEEPLKDVHEKLRPKLSEEEKSAIVGLLVDQSRTSESNSLQFLKFFKEFSLVKQFKRDWEGRGEYGSQHGDRLLERVLELSTSQSDKIREETTHVLREFGGRTGIAISMDYVQRLAEGLISLVKDRNVSVVRWAIPALADHASDLPEQYHQETRVLIEKSLQSYEPSVRAAGTWALGQVSALYPGETSKLVQLILTQLHDKNFEVIDNAIIALDSVAYSASASIGEVEEDLYKRLVEIAETSGGNRLDWIGSVLTKIGRTLPEPIRTRYEAQKAERLRFEQKIRSRDKAEK